MTISTTTSTKAVEMIEVLSEMVDSLRAEVDELKAEVEELKAKGPEAKDRGPKSERTMTEKDAWRIRFGDLKAASHKSAAKELGLSYGQVYSARGGYTFTAVKAESFKS